jgi:hypothetical protein
MAPAPHVDGDPFWGLARSRRRGPSAGCLRSWTVAGGRGLGLTLPERREIAALVAARSTSLMEERIAQPTGAREAVIG